MPPLNEVRFTVDADVNGDGAAETGTFVMRGNIEVTPTIRTGFLIDNKGSTINSVISDSAGDGESIREGIYLDLGGGVRAVEVQFTQWEGASHQWGNTGDDSEVTVADSTGEGPLTQLDMLMQYLAVAEVDSRNPATLEYLEHHSNGLYDPMDVVMESPQGTKSAQDGSWFTGKITFLSVQSIERAIDGQGLTG